MYNIVSFLVFMIFVSFQTWLLCFASNILEDRRCGYERSTDKIDNWNASKKMLLPIFVYAVYTVLSIAIDVQLFLDGFFVVTFVVLSAFVLHLWMFLFLLSGRHPEPID